MNEKEQLSIELYSLTKLYLAQENNQAIIDRLKEDIKNCQRIIDGANQQIPQNAKDTRNDEIRIAIAKEAKRYVTNFYKIVFKPLRDGSVSTKFGAFAKMFSFDYPKFVQEYLTDNKGRISSEFYAFTQKGDIKFSKQDVNAIVDNFIDVTTWLITDKLKREPHQFACGVDYKDDKYEVLIKILKNSVSKYYKSLVGALANYGYPLIKFSHAGQTYEMTAPGSDNDFYKLKPHTYPSMFNYFIKSQKTFMTSAWVKKPKVDKYYIETPTTGHFELCGKLAEMIESYVKENAQKAAQKQNALTLYTNNKQQHERDLAIASKKGIDIKYLISPLLFNLKVIPPFYAENPDAIKKMCFLFMNKRASNIEDLINLYETEEWRNKVLQSINGVKNVLYMSQQNLASQLRALNANANDTNKALIGLANKINDVKIDVDVTTTVHVEDNRV